MGIKNREYFVTIHKMDLESACVWWEENARAWVIAEEVGRKENYIYKD